MCGLLGGFEGVQIGELNARGLCRRHRYADVPVQPELAGQRGRIEIGNPVLAWSEVIKGGAAAEIGRSRSYQIVRAGKLHNALLNTALSLALQVHPMRMWIQVPEFGVESL